jgi:rhodanese-related sulfurtransferase
MTLAFATTTLPAVAADKASAHKVEAPHVTLEEMKGIVAGKTATVFDCNSAATYAEGHIPGAVSFAANETNFASVLPKDKNALIVAYCGGTMCSAWEAAAKEAQRLGYTNVKHFPEGIKGWKDAKLTVESGSARKS